MALARPLFVKLSEIKRAAAAMRVLLMILTASGARFESTLEL